MTLWPAVGALIIFLQGATLPDAPQAKAVHEFVNAFNQGTQADVLKVLEKYGSPERVKKRTPEQRAEAYQQMKQNIGTFRIVRVISSSPLEIVVAVPRLDGREAVWTFAFEPGNVVRFAGISGGIPEP